MQIGGIKLGLCNGVYEPREDSWLLAKVVEKKAFGRVLDLGTGTGIQGITAALNGCDVTFADIDIGAVECAKRNAALNNVCGKFICSDLFSNIKESFNTIVFNPPYLESNTVRDRALDGGRKGRLLINRFLKSYRKYVLPDHKILLLESSINEYWKDIEKLNASIIAKEHYFFEDIVVLLFE